MPALMAAAACSEESDGDLGEVGLGIDAPGGVVGPVPCAFVVVMIDSELMSGDMLAD